MYVVDWYQAIIIYMILLWSLACWPNSNKAIVKPCRSEYNLEFSSCKISKDNSDASNLSGQGSSWAQIIATWYDCCFSPSRPITDKGGGTSHFSYPLSPFSTVYYNSWSVELLGSHHHQELWRNKCMLHLLNYRTSITLNCDDTATFIFLVS